MDQKKLIPFLSGRRIVLMPGLDGTGKSFEPLLPFIAPDARVTVVRYPQDRCLSFEETVACAASQIPPDGLPVVIAESFSGPVAVKMLASGLVKAGALVLCATFARAPHPVLWRIVRFLRLPLAIRPDMPRAFFKFIIGNDKRIDELLPLWKTVHEAVPARIMAFRLSLVSQLDVTAELHQLTIPCCYLQALQDRIVPSSCLKDFTRGIPHLYVRKIDAPHFILQAEPYTCLAAIDEFLHLKSVG